MNEVPRHFRLFAVDVYGREGVRPACLLLQDRFGVDVNVLLLAAYVGATTGAAFTEAAVSAAVARTERWRRDVVEPLRAVRNRLMDGPPPAPSAATAALRERIKAAELEAELIELDELADVASRLGACPPRPDAPERAAEAMRAVLRHYGRCDAGTQVEDSIAVIASATTRFGER